jgi:tetratricopeptide (TPR) repeat protein
MKNTRIILKAGAIVLLIGLCTGCVSGPAKSCPNCTVVKTPIAPAADLFAKGFDAYINQDYPKALEYYNQSLAADPKSIQVWISKGNVLVRMNRSGEAVMAYDSALAIDDSITEIWNLRGKAQMAAGNYSAASESFDRALALEPNYREARENRNLSLAKLK